MRRLIYLVVIGIAATGLRAHGQLAVQLRMERDTFLRYESIPVAVSIRNFSGRAIQLNDKDERAWLEFVISDEGGSMVRAVGKPRDEEPLSISPGQTVTRTLDLLPLYDLRDRGTYRVQAIVERGGARTVSQALRFTIVHGRELWSETAGLPTGDSDEDQYRTYSLQTRRDAHYDMMYVCVEDRAKQVIYGALPLGVYVAIGQPETRIDKSGHLHVLFQTGPRSFRYIHVDPQAKILDQAIYSDLMSQPALSSREDGTVLVSGGEKVFPREERAMRETPAQQAPPAEKKPRRSWWPFGKRKTPEQSVETNVPSTNFGPR